MGVRATAAGSSWAGRNSGCRFFGFRVGEVGVLCWIFIECKGMRIAGSFRVPGISGFYVVPRSLVAGCGRRWMAALSGTARDARAGAYGRLSHGTGWALRVGEAWRTRPQAAVLSGFGVRVVACMVLHAGGIGRRFCWPIRRGRWDMSVEPLAEDGVTSLEGRVSEENRDVQRAGFILRLRSAGSFRSRGHKRQRRGDTSIGSLQAVGREGLHWAMAHGPSSQRWWQKARPARSFRSVCMERTSGRLRQYVKENSP